MKIYLIISIFFSMLVYAEGQVKKKCPALEVEFLSPSTENDIAQISRKSCELVRDCNELKKIPECLSYVDSTKFKYQSFLEELFLKEESEDYLELFNIYLPFYHALMPHCPQLNFNPVGDEIGFINKFYAEDKKIKSSDQFKDLQKSFELPPDDLKKLELSDKDFSRVLADLILGKPVDIFYSKNKEIIFSMFNIDRKDRVEYRNKNDLLKKKFIEAKVDERSNKNCIKADSLSKALEGMGRYFKAEIVNACMSYDFPTSKMEPDIFIYSCLFYCDKQFGPKINGQNWSLSLGLLSSQSLGLLSSRSRNTSGRTIASIEKDDNQVDDKENDDFSNSTSNHSDFDPGEQEIDFSTPENEKRFFEGMNIKLNTFSSMISNSVQMNIPLKKEELQSMISEISTYRKKLKKKKESKVLTKEEEQSLEKMEAALSDVVSNLGSAKVESNAGQELSSLKKEANEFRDLYTESRKKDAFVQSENARLRNENDFLKRRLEDRNRELEQVRRSSTVSEGSSEPKGVLSDRGAGLGSSNPSSPVLFVESGKTQKNEIQEVRFHPVEFYSYPYKLKKNASTEEIYNLILKSNGNPIYLGEDEELLPELNNGKIVLDDLGNPKFKKRKIKIIIDSAYKISSADLSLMDQREIYRYQLLDLNRSISSSMEK